MKTMFRYRSVFARFLVIAFLVGLTATVQGAPPAQEPSPTGRKLNLCFAEGTSEEYVKKVYEEGFGEILTFFPFPDIWHWDPAWTATGDGSDAQGEPLTLTWSIIPDGTVMSDSYGTCTSSLIADMDAIYGSGNWQAEIANIFAEWASKTGNQYVYEPNDDGAAWPYYLGQPGVRGDLRIGGCSIDGNYGILAYNYYPSNGDMKIDSKDIWYAMTTLATGFHNVVSHEHGHGKGIQHVCPVNQTKLMEPYVTTVFTGPQHDDIRAAQRGYGDYNEIIGGTGNDMAAGATDLGSPPDGVLVAMREVSIDDDSDQDWYQFTVGANRQVDVTVRPVGFTYLNGPQNSDGSCTPGTSLDSLAIHNLGFEVRDSDGTTVLATGNSNPAGAAETLNDVALGAAGVKYIRVYGDSTNEIQLYDLEITVEPAEPGADLAISKADHPDPVIPGNPLTYTIAVTNTGPSDATGVVVTDILPLTVAFASSSASQGTCSGISTITCDLGNINNGASATVTILVTPTASGTFTNTASVTSRVTDPNMANNSATASTTACYDFNGNGWVDVADIQAVANHWRCKCGDACYDPLYDIDDDCDIDVVDIMLVVAHWGETC